MLPADIIAEITTNLAALHLEPNTTAQILAAVFAPLLRNSGPPVPAPELPPKHAQRRRGGRPRKRARGASRPRRYKRHAPTEARDRALAAWRENPDANPTEVAKLAKVSRSTAANARKRLAREARRAARKSKKTSSEKPAPNSDRRQRAQRFLQETLAKGPKEVQAVEAAAAKARIDDVVLSQARADLGVVATRADSGGHAVQWSLPG